MPNVRRIEAAGDVNILITNETVFAYLRGKIHLAEAGG